MRSPSPTWGYTSSRDRRRPTSSTCGPGSRSSERLPRASSAPPPAVPLAGRSSLNIPRRGSNRLVATEVTMPTAVLVDDSPIMRAQLRALLRQAGVDVAGEGASGDDVLWLYESLQP